MIEVSAGRYRRRGPNPFRSKRVGAARAAFNCFALSLVLASTSSAAIDLEKANTEAISSFPNASSKPDMGIQFHCNWRSYTNHRRRTILNKLAAAGVKWVRIDTGWAGIEANSKGDRNAWYLRMTDFCVDEAARRGINVLMTLWLTPSWANGGRGVSVPPTNPQDYADFARWAAARWKGKVQAYEVWNEPDPSQSFWQGTTAQLVALMKSGYGAIKTGDPGALVVFPAPSTNNDTWIDEVYAAGAKGYFDVMATHPYQGLADAPPEHPDDGNRWWFTHLPAVRAVMVKHGDGDMPVWFTEFGWSLHDNWAGIANGQRGVTAVQQASYLTRAVAYTRTNYPYVKVMLWYKERAWPGSNDIHMEGYGLLNADLSERPVYLALKQLTGH